MLRPRTAYLCIWDSSGCQKELPQKSLNHAGIPFEPVWNLNARIAHNPYTGKDELSVDWLTVDYYIDCINTLKIKNNPQG